MKTLLVGSLGTPDELTLAADVLPAALTSLGVDLTVAVGFSPLGFEEPGAAAERLAGLGVDLFVLPSSAQRAPALEWPRPTLAVPNERALLTSAVVHRARGEGLAVVAVRAGSRKHLLDLHLRRIRDEVRAVAGDGLAALVLVSGATVEAKVAVFEAVRDRASAVIGLGSGIPTADARILAPGCAWLGDLGLAEDRPPGLEAAPGTEEAVLDTLLLSTNDATRRAVSFERHAWRPGERPGGATDEGFSHESFYHAMKKGYEAEDERALFDEMAALAHRALGHQRIAAGWWFADTERPRFLGSQEIFPDDLEAFSHYLTPVLGRDEAMLSPARPVDVAGVPWLLAGEWRLEGQTPQVRCVLGVTALPDRARAARARELAAEIYATFRASLVRLQFVRSLQRQIATTGTLLKISEAVGTTIDLDDLLRKVMDLVSGAVESEGASVLLLDERTGELVARGAAARAPGSAAAPAPRRFPADRGVPGWVVRHRQSLLVNDPAGDKRHLAPLDGETLAAARNVMCVPLRAKDRIIGVLQVFNKREGRPFTDRDLRLLESVANQCANPLENARLHGDLREVYLSTVEALASAIDAKDRYTHGHSRRVTEYALAMAGELNWDEAAREELRYVGLLHDIGKIGVEDAILTKKGALTDDERKKINLHPARGAEMLEHVSFLVNKIPGVRHHHERYDGTGYPDGLRGDQIPLHAQLVCIVDAFDAMTSDRPYRSGMEPEVALERILQASGTQFAPRYVELFARIYEARILPVYARYRQTTRGEAAWS